MARLQILSNDDFNKLYKIPIIDKIERPNIFELDQDDKNYLNTQNNVETKINYILHLGYFRITQYFFSFKIDEVKEDVEFIFNIYFSHYNKSFKQISNKQNYANRDSILNKYKTSLFSKVHEDQLLKYLKSIVRNCVKITYMI